MCDEVLTERTLTRVEAIRLKQLIITVSAWLGTDCAEQVELQTEAAFLLRGLARFYPVIELGEVADEQ